MSLVARSAARARLTALSVLALVAGAAACAAPQGDGALEDAARDDDIVTANVTIKGEVAYGGNVSSTFQAWRTQGWTFTGQKGDKLDAALAGVAGEGTDTVLRLYGPRSGAGYGVRALARDDDSGDARSSKLRGFELNADGEYLLAASCKGGSQCNGKAYSLALACASGPCAAAGPAPTKGSIHIEVDYAGFQRFEPGTMDMVTKYFASIGYELTFEESDKLEPVDYLPYGQSSKVLQDYYVRHFDHRGQKGWHYMLMGDALENGNRGWGLLGGDMFIVSADPLSLHPQRKAQAQANMILHELGHNLGLAHEGFEPELAAGTHDRSTCATADTAGAPDADDIPVRYSPTCLRHITLDSIAMVK